MLEKGKVQAQTKFSALQLPIAFMSSSRTAEVNFLTRHNVVMIAKSKL